MAKKLVKKPNAKKTGAKAGAKASLPPSLASALASAPKSVRKAVKKTAPRPRHDIDPAAIDGSADVLDRLWGVVMARRDADPNVSHSARLLSRGMAKVAQKFGEEAVECVIEAVSGDKQALIAESADVLYHLLVIWVSAGLHPSQIWAELERRQGVSGVAEKAARKLLVSAVASRKIP